MIAMYLTEPHYHCHNVFQLNYIFYKLLKVSFKYSHHHNTPDQSLARRKQPLNSGEGGGAVLDS